MLYSHCLQILNYVIFEFVFWKSSPMRHWRMPRSQGWGERIAGRGGGWGLGVPALLCLSAPKGTFSAAYFPLSWHPGPCMASPSQPPPNYTFALYSDKCLGIDRGRVGVKLMHSAVSGLSLPGAGSTAVLCPQRLTAKVSLPPSPDPQI